MLLWILDPAGRDATIVNQALNGEITDLRAATEVICSRTPSQLQIMQQTYRTKFGCYLDHASTERTFGDHQKVLLRLSVLLVHLNL
jgi:annexin A7/11